MEQYERVIEIFFAYANMIREKGAQRYIFEEIKRVGEINFEFADKRNALNNCVNLAGKM